MSNMRRSLATSVLLIVGLCGWCASAVRAQEPDDDEQRQIFPEFTKKRPGGPSRSTPQTGTSRIKRGGDNPTQTNKNQESKMLGVTFWRGRPGTASDDPQARILDQGDDSDIMLIGERVNSDAKFKEGQKVRLGIESPQSGYLYIIDREQYADGTYSDPYLIFPTLKLRRGDNLVTAGRLIEIPDQEARRPWLTMNRNHAARSGPPVEQTAEVLTIMVMSQPLPNIKPEPTRQKLSNEQFSQWQEKFKAAVKRVDLKDRAGKTYTKTEKDAAASDKTLLKPDDPPPQTIYRITTKLGGELLINVTLQYETGASSKPN